MCRFTSTINRNGQSRYEFIDEKQKNILKSSSIRKADKDWMEMRFQTLDMDLQLTYKDMWTYLWV